MRFLAGLLVLTGVATFATSVAAQDGYAEFGAFLEEFRKDGRTRSLSAVIVKDGEIVWEGYYGTFDDEGDLPTAADTTYSIASVTKPIAATAIVAESLAGGLDLSLPMRADEGWDDICGWLSGSEIPFGGGGEDDEGRSIAPMDCSAPTTLAQMLDMRANGAAFVYNPIAFARIDRAILGAGGRDLRAIVRDRVVEPAGMRNVALGWHDPEEGDALRFLAPPFAIVDDRSIKQTISDDDFRASAGIKASPRAIAAFDIAYDGGVLIPASVRQSTIGGAELGPMGDYRGGWFLEDWNGKRLMWHSGWDPDRYSALYLKVPEDRLTLIVLANSDAIWWDNSPVEAEVTESPIARRFLESFSAEPRRAEDAP
jgi:CubicO group peptidase (beta-lactamase class C family)